MKKLSSSPQTFILSRRKENSYSIINDKKKKEMVDAEEEEEGTFLYHVIYPSKTHNLWCQGSFAFLQCLEILTNHRSRVNNPLKVWWLFCDDCQSWRGNQPEAFAGPKVRTFIQKASAPVSAERIILEKRNLFRETRELDTPQSLGQLEAQVKDCFEANFQREREKRNISYNKTP